MLAYLTPEKYDFGPVPTIFPEGLEKTPRRFAISARNTYMIKKCDVATVYVRSPGGAQNFADAALRAGKTVINLAEE